MYNLYKAIVTIEKKKDINLDEPFLLPISTMASLIMVKYGGWEAPALAGLESAELIFRSNRNTLKLTTIAH